MILLAAVRSHRLFGTPAKYFATVELREVDSLRSVAIGLRPGLCDLIDHPCGQLVFALAHDGSDLEEVFRTLGIWHIAPRLECLGRGVDRLLDKRRVGIALGKYADHLLDIGRVATLEF